MAVQETYAVFLWSKLLTRGPLREALVAAKRHIDAEDDQQGLLVFRLDSGAQIDFDWRGSVDEVLARGLKTDRDANPRRAGPGRPRLGVVSREISLLPRHWAWLQAQPNGISATLRRLVDEARKNDDGRRETRRAQDAAYHVMTALAGDLPNYEEATRALYAGNRNTFAAAVKGWPGDVKSVLMDMAGEVFEPESPKSGKV